MDITRRDALRKLAAIGCGCAAYPLIFDIGNSLAQGKAGSGLSGVQIVRVSGEDSIKKLLARTLSELGGMGRFVKRGDIVVVKPNIGWDRTPEQAANTNPILTAAVVEAAYEAGARKVKVFDRTCMDARRCYSSSGIADAVKKVDGEVSYVDDRKYAEVDFSGTCLSKWPVYKEIIEADKVINVPIAKHHSLAGLTMAVKNWMGVLGGNRGYLHRNMDHCLADLAGYFKPALTILDAYRILFRNGPTGGNESDVKKATTLVAGTDQIAVDACGTELFSDKSSMPEYLQIAEKRGYGKTDFRDMNFKDIKINS